MSTTDHGSSSNDRRTALVLGKYFDDEVYDHMIRICEWLRDERDVRVIVSDEIAEKSGFVGHSDVEGFEELVDFVVAVGGDGTLLYVNSLFPNRVPPVIPFSVGSLAFMAIFDVEEYKEVIDKVLEGHSPVLNRYRLEASVFRHESETPEITRVVLNETVVDKGASGSLCTLDTYCDGHHITTVTGDGIIVGSATGSTAYNLAAGGSMVHPMVKAILFTPICPHSLSFRPVIIPADVEVRIEVPFDARISAWVQFDGRHQTELQHGDSLRICMNRFPLPTICKSDGTAEWFTALAGCLHWNLRQRQKSLPQTESAS